MPTARELLDLVFDHGTWSSWDPPAAASPGTDGPATDRPGADEPGVAGAGIDPAYAAALAAARERTGSDESVLTGEGRIDGRRVSAVACEFGFLGGSVGATAAGRLVAAIERATAEGLPVLASPASGGARMQEGAQAFIRLAAVSAAVGRHIAAGLPYLVYLRHPTTGGVFASWGSLGQLTAAEPGALIGYHGPRVSQALTGAPFPAGVQVAEHLCAHGLVDAVVPPHGLATLARRALEVMCAAPAGQAPEPPVRPEPPLGPEPPVGPVRLDPLPGPEPPDQAVRPEPPVRPEPLLGPEPPGPPVRPEPPVQPGLPDVPAWEVVERSRRATRPGVVALLTAAAGSVTRLADPGPGLVLALARFGAAPCVLIGQDRRGPAPGPDGVRAARRGLRLATELRLPLVSVIDTAGAELSRRAEEGGLAAEIARSVAELLALPVPTLCLLLGQGAGGAALAHLPADRLVAAQHGWLSPLPPEGAAAILHRDADRAPELAAALRIRASDLLAVGIVDYVVPEYPDAAAEPMRFLRRVGAVLAAELAALLDRDPAERLAARAARYAR